MSKISNSEQAYQLLRSHILEGRLAPGATLRTASLAKEYDVGLTPLREALSRLQSEDLVVAAFNVGFRVAGSSIEELEDLGRVRAMIDSEMLVSAMQQGDEDWENAIVAAHYQLKKCPAPDLSSTSEELELWTRRHDAFHTALVSACTSDWLRRMADQIDAQLQRYHRSILIGLQEIVGRNPDLSDEINETLETVLGIDCHSVLIDAVLERNYDKACCLIREHCNLASITYLKFQHLILERSAA